MELTGDLLRTVSRERWEETADLGFRANERGEKGKRGWGTDGVQDACGRKRAWDDSWEGTEARVSFCWLLN